MKKLVIAAAAISALGHVHASADLQCDINQSATKLRIQESARKIPNVQLSNEGRTFSWTTAQGEQVKISHSGCFDLGTVVEINFGTHVGEDRSISRVIDIMKEHWSKPAANRLQAELSDNKLVRKVKDDGTVEWTSKVPDEAGFTVRIVKDRITVNWLDG